MSSCGLVAWLDSINIGMAIVIVGSVEGIDL